MRNVLKILSILCLLSFVYPLQAQDCDCTVSQVEGNTVPSCNLTIGTELSVNSVSGLKYAISQVNSSGGNMTILIANGTYEIASQSSFPYITASNIVIRSLSGNRDSVIIRGGGMRSTSSTEDGLLIAGNNVTIADLTIKEVGNHGIQVSGHNLYVHNVKIQNTFEQMIKGSTSAASIDSAIVQCSLLEYSAGIGPQFYIGGLDIHKGIGWIVRDNVLKNISSPSGSVAEHAIHFWNNSSGNTVERNRIINCDRGIGFGLGSSANTGGIIRNNMIYNDGTGPFNDVGIGLETSPNTKVYNNTVYVDYSNAIEYRFAATTNVEVKNNLTNKPITSRNGGSAILATNLINAQASWFENISSGDLHLASSISTVVDQGTNIPCCIVDDIDKTSRPQGLGFDIGAHEYNTLINSQNEKGLIDPILIFPNPNNGSFRVINTNAKQSEIIIYTIYGEKVFTTKIESENIVIELGNQPPAIYFYQLISNKQIYKTGKIIIQ